ncbi:ribulose-phosphate 3-epimerase [Companilactobacillus paralimentarius DSM 13238 = JCM 10415]|jgi:ribulose-phosphate 3-epimerase|uniref:Ribulose-phosphate 3-epimerase n=1 Tax=Companilactobacillus paralimentarius DSM 13238 = JCM 10415 TaxID=1122151 RepID=A0A0R1PHW6_9LACO|nr:ribulose-phosphate 3-epimerase [Companilactobacillus paralimentarius]KAE9561863.1 ribulose phosphate epimerase [Companilactobacillus paralimentarius]KRL28152.1 ribulose-phosphate 3-epimerase [Companilactobacillus paralimentarius DSM 13238 = JCM 10415]MDR4934307.1 ribulose-phosphate 3-epimerase [Companilactobacillus paralimentarius]QFR68552.1 ribulose-phosphate 3-epimerase [Companilactobacillus paralimentarius]
MTVKIAPSILSADIMNLERDVKVAEQAGADLFHIDIMDGHFVPNMSFSPSVVEGMRRVTDKPLDVHLMIDNPDAYIKPIVDAGADTILVHAESTQHIYRSIDLIKSLGVKAGVVVNPGTPLETVKELFPVIDQILVMTVNPGFGGQKFIPGMTKKIQRLDQLRQTAADDDFQIEVDGGINNETIAQCAHAGADIFVAGSYLYGHDDIKDRVDNLKSLAVNAKQ